MYNTSPRLNMFWYGVRGRLCVCRSVVHCPRCVYECRFGIWDCVAYRCHSWGACLCVCCSRRCIFISVFANGVLCGLWQNGGNVSTSPFSTCFLFLLCLPAGFYAGFGKMRRVPSPCTAATKARPLCVFHWIFPERSCPTSEKKYGGAGRVPGMYAFVGSVCWREESIMYAKMSKFLASNFRDLEKWWALAVGNCGVVGHTFLLRITSTCATHLHV